MPLFLKTIELYNREGDKSIPVNNILLMIYAIISILCILYITIRIVRIRRKRIILESELLSVNACAILWNAVVVDHFRALQSIGADENSWNIARYENYTKNLLEQADEIKKNTNRLYDWIDRK